MCRHKGGSYRGPALSLLILVFPIVLAAACYNDDKCLTANGPAQWTGDCSMGVATGEGTATYTDGIYSSIEGTFQKGAAVGEVRITFWDGGYYVGGWRDDNPHGFGLDMRPWGEGYEGGWSEGFQEGEGTYITPEGRRIRGLWEREGLPSAWYTDPDTGCEIWLSPSSEPIGEARWSGPCQDGKAHGAGTIVWSDKGESYVPKELIFVGQLVEGMIAGRGKMVEVSRHSNVTNTSVYEGEWLHGRRSGTGKEMRTVEHTDGGSLVRTEAIHEGEWEDGAENGPGQRSKLVLWKGGNRTTSKATGSFRNGRLLGSGRFEEFSEGSGERRHDVREGILDDNNNLTGLGTATSETVSSKGRSYSEISGDWSGDELQGRITFLNGFRFEGTFHQSETPKRGNCTSPNNTFDGQCEALSESTSGMSGRTCLVPIGKKEPCLIEVSSWVS